MDVKLKDLLEEKRSDITKKWFEAIMETYPTEATGFLRKQKDMFANPMSWLFSPLIYAKCRNQLNELEGVFDILRMEKDYQNKLTKQN